ncbi:MAG TPA: putative ABC transporter permease [Clostridiales bacterium]|nr:putative ABC transporter permease [Clostridiales bacterium]
MYWVKTYLLFMLYSFIGWIYETILCSVLKGEFVNRGFLHGPYCPIYGFGAILIILLLTHYVQNALSLFVLSSVLATAFEYASSYILEKLFNQRWWDYSNMRFNINGRVCLEGALIFGALSVLLVYYIHPLSMRLLEKASPLALKVIAVMLFVVFATDVIVTVAHLLDIRRGIEEVQNLYNTFVEKVNIIRH